MGKPSFLVRPIEEIVPAAFTAAERESHGNLTRSLEQGEFTNPDGTLNEAYYEACRRREIQNVAEEAERRISLSLLLGTAIRSGLERAAPKVGLGELIPQDTSGMISMEPAQLALLMQADQTHSSK